MVVQRSNQLVVSTQEIKRSNECTTVYCNENPEKDNRWIHVAMKFDTKPEEVKIFKD